MTILPFPDKDWSLSKNTSFYLSKYVFILDFLRDVVINIMYNLYSETTQGK